MSDQRSCPSMGLLPVTSNSSFPTCRNGPLDHRDENLELVPLQPHNNPSSSNNNNKTTAAAAADMPSWGVIFDTVVKGLTMAVHLITLTEKGWKYARKWRGVKKEEEKEIEMGP
ncbi:serine threonine kinase, partial [Fusarium mexicanum]